MWLLVCRVWLLPVPAPADMVAPFLREDLDPAQFAKDIVRLDARGADDDPDGAAMAVGESHTESALHRLAARLRGLDVAIRGLVGEHQGELLEQAGQTSELKGEVDAIVQRVARVRSSESAAAPRCCSACRSHHAVPCCTVVCDHRGVTDHR